MRSLCLLAILACLFFEVSFSQNNIATIKVKYEVIYSSLEKLIQSNGSFKEAVFLSEQDYQNKAFLQAYDYENLIMDYVELVKKHCITKKLISYSQPDSTNYLLNLALYDLLLRPIGIKSDSAFYKTVPFKYSFTDPQGDKDFTNTFVTKLLLTHQGNCRSITYLYKILADEVGAKCWLALAPNHIYVRNYSKQVGWYNTELTSGTFPTDAWIAASSYVNIDAIRSGLYMDTLSNQQTIGLCVIDLLHGYIRQINNYTDGFVLKGCDLVLKYHPVNPMAILLKAEALKRLYQQERSNKDVHAETTFIQMQDTYAELIKLGYREMPKKAYQQWLANLSKEKEKFQNQDLLKISTPLKTDSISTAKPLKAF